MAYVVCLDPQVRIDFMVRKEHQAELVGYIRRMECNYKKEVEKTFPNGETWICLKDIQAKNGRQIGELIGLFYSIEWVNLVEGTEDKYYMMITNRNRGKKYAGKNRQKVHSGRKGGAAGEPAGAGDHSGHGKDDGSGRDIVEPGDFGPDDLRDE